METFDDLVARMTAGDEGQFAEAQALLGELQDYLKRCEPWLALIVRRSA